MLSAGDPRPTRWLVVRGELLAQVAAGVEQAARSPRRSTLRDSIPDQPYDGPPPEVAGALWPLPSGGPWEGGTVDRTGQRWTHQPWQGWRPAGTPPHIGRGRVYTSGGVRRARRRELLVRWTAGPVLALAGVMVCAGLVNTAAVWALAGLALAAVVLGMAWSVGRR